MTCSQRGSATRSSEPVTASPQRASSRGMVLMATGWLAILMTLSGIVVRADGFVVEPASPAASMQRRLNDSVVKKSSTGQCHSNEEPR